MKINSYQELRERHFDEIIDVRSPSEFAEDHVPGAVNLPVLDDEERALIGTIYVQESRFRARKMGAALVARNAARHLEAYLSGKGHDYKPLVYCWRGGQRSGSFATILKSIGWQAETLDGGYKTYRKLVWERLYEKPLVSPVVLLDGNTGTGKTALLKRLRINGMQVIDLEELANHRGSLFGAEANPQPSQKAFESALAEACFMLDDDLPVIVEAESSLVGQRAVPPSLFVQMKSAPRIFIDAPIAERARHSVEQYSDLTADLPELAARIERLRPYHSGAQVDAWLAMAAAGTFEAVAEEIMQLHYDPRYGRQRAKCEEIGIVELRTPDLSDDGLDKMARQIPQLVSDLLKRPLKCAS